MPSRSIRKTCFRTEIARSRKWLGFGGLNKRPLSRSAFHDLNDRLWVVGEPEACRSVPQRVGDGVL